MLAKGKVKKLTAWVSESATRHGQPVSVLLVELAKKHGLAGATVTRGVMGYGSSGKIHAPHLVSGNLPLKVEIIDTPEAIERILPDVYEIVEHGLVELSDVEAVKFESHAPLPAPPTHVKLEGKAKMLRIFVEAVDQWQGEPLHEALVKRLRQLDIAGVTVFRGVLGYGANGRVHRHKALRHDEPIELVVVDTAEKLATALPAIDEMIGGGMVVMSDVDVMFYRAKG